MTEKETQFITFVQTGVIVESAKDGTDVVDVLRIMENAFYTMKRLPEDANPLRAARNFLSTAFVKQVA